MVKKENKEIVLKRKVYNKLLKERDNNKIIILLGARQVGKTTILKSLHKEVSGLFLDLDILENFEKIDSYSNFINTLKLEGYGEKQKKTFYVFLDEFQRYEDLSKIIKNVYDNHKNIKIYASGSSSLKIKEQVQESLAGRKKIYEIYPLDFEEFLISKQDANLITKYKNIKKLKGENLKIGKLKTLLNEYLIYGGYPEVVLSDDKDKPNVLKSIFDLYVKKELVGYLKLNKILGVKKLIECLAINNGQKIKYEEISEKTSLKHYEVKEYLEVLRETFLIQELRPFFTNKNKELIKIPKIYFLDNGVRNYFINNFNKLDIRSDGGFLFEGFVFQELLKNKTGNLNFWQDKQGHEIDFIIDKIHEKIPLEVKFKEKIKNTEVMNLKSFLEDYKIKEGYLINLGIQKIKNKINFVLPFDLNF